MPEGRTRRFVGVERLQEKGPNMKAKRFGAAETAPREMMSPAPLPATLEREVQRNLNQPWTADGALDESCPQGGRAVTKRRGCGRDCRNCALPCTAVCRAGLKVWTETRIQADVVVRRIKA